MLTRIIAKGWKTEEAWYRRQMKPSKAIEEFLEKYPEITEIKVKIMKEKEDEK